MSDEREPIDLEAVERNAHALLAELAAPGGFGRIIEQGRCAGHVLALVARVRELEAELAEEHEAFGLEIDRCIAALRERDQARAERDAAVTLLREAREEFLRQTIEGTVDHDTSAGLYHRIDASMWAVDVAGRLSCDQRGTVRSAGKKLLLKRCWLKSGFVHVAASVNPVRAG